MSLALLAFDQPLEPNGRQSLITDLDSIVFDVCGCCEPDQDGTVREAFFAILHVSAKT